MSCRASQELEGPIYHHGFGLQVQCSFPEASRCHTHEVTTQRSLPGQHPEAPQQLSALVTLEDRAPRRLTAQSETSSIFIYAL